MQAFIIVFILVWRTVAILVVMKSECSCQLLVKSSGKQDMKTWLLTLIVMRLMLRLLQRSQNCLDTPEI